MNKSWLLDNADTPICYNLNKSDDEYKLLQNSEVTAWLSSIAERSQTNNIGDIHGSHDYRMENILGKCWILGLSNSIPAFAGKIEFILDYLNRHIQKTPADKLSFSKIYHYRDHEKVLSCFLPFLGYHDDPAVLHIVKERINILYTFTRNKHFNIYTDGSKMKGVKKEWQPYIINPELYSNGHIALPDIHDFILFAGMLTYLSEEEREKVETITEWIFEDGYRKIIRRYGYFYVNGGTYNVKAVIFKLNLLDFKDMTFDNGDLSSLLFNMFILSHFKTGRESEWFKSGLSYLEQYKKENGRYIFPSYLIVEKPDSYVVFGGHMNVGENKKSKHYKEIISTYWMERIYCQMI
jgi:hypothetical protein